MSDIEALMYSYPSQGQAGFTALLSAREELWPSIFVSQEQNHQMEEKEGSPEAGEEDEADKEPEDEEKSRENVARHSVREICKRFMLVYDRLFLYYSTGSGKTVISSHTAEPLARDIAEELVTSYLEPRRTNITKVIVIVSSDAQKRDFMKKIIETSRRPEYEKAARIGATQPLNERLATYANALSNIYTFHTKTSFLTSVYGTSSIQRDVDPTKPDPRGLAFANNSVILIDEIHSFSREDTTGISTSPQEDDEKKYTDDEDIRYAQYHYILHAVQGSKIIGLSATPMKDSPHEIIKVLNLILPIDKQIPNTINVLSRKELIPYIEGYVSYFRTRSTRVMNRGVMFSLEEDTIKTAETLEQSKDCFEDNCAPEFEVLYPVQMSDHQAKTYARVIGEKDSFNRNALRTSTIVYPDGSSDHTGFMSRFVRSTRGWDGMEPTEEYKTFLHSSRANRELLSTKICAIADLCRISRGVIFVYMRNLEGGLYDVASFLDAEGFERFSPETSQQTRPLYIKRTDGSNEMIISKRLRYVLIIGETKTVPGRLDTILNLVNLDENADGEYVKIVLGSAAVRESFDIRNSITMIIASPEQTETAMIQAQGRIVRPGAQKALLRRFPDLPPIVNVYRLASFVPGTNYEGKDVDTYLDSARKDRKIKVVERMLRDSSVDCRMLHEINYDYTDDVVNDSPACLYGPCDYMCSIEGIAPEVLDSSSMNALYTREKVSRLSANLADIAKRQVYIPFAYLDKVVDSHALAQKIVETTSIRKNQFRDRYGRQSYVYHDRNGVFFSTNPVITGRVGDGSGQMCPVSMSDYEHYITTSLITTLDALSGTSLTYPRMIESILTSAPDKITTGSLESDMDLLKRFSLYIRREVVPKSLLLEHVRVRGEQRAYGIKGDNVYWVDYTGLLYTRGELRIYDGDEGITYLVDKTSSGQPLRILPLTTIGKNEEAGSWSTPEPSLMRILQQRWRKYMRSLFAPYETRFPYYGVLRPSDPQKLRIARRGRDNAKTPGRALTSWVTEDLKEVLAMLLSNSPETPTALRLKEAGDIIDSFSSQTELNDYLIGEFDRMDLLLRL